MDARNDADDLRGYEVDPEDERNQERAQAQKLAEEPHGILGAAERMINSLVRPLTRRGTKLSPEEQEKVREETDREERGDQSDVLADR